MARAHALAILAHALAILAQSTCTFYGGEWHEYWHTDEIMQQH